ncbi:MAG TPA: glycosyl hydrolase [Saprospiraceae bacterium]|nr:glycosyl hydrolase [Saprospiraceae bacterium]
MVNEISFVRVVPWNWVTKKGVSSATIELNSTWKYLWNNTGASTINREFAPMSWGAGGANSDAVIELYKTKYKSTHVMGFNESDNCNDQSGRFNNLCQPAVAVGFYKNLMKTGLRLVSPNCREEAPFGWLKQFHDIASAQDVRIDVIGVHWYDWGSNPVNSPNADPVMVFNRFKSYLDRVYALYKLPIWISEFNANPNRSSATNLEFMKLALPYLESLDYVERYCWYQPNSGVANYYQSDGTSLTAVGLFYRDQISTPSITKAIVDAPSSLDLYYNILSPVIDDKLDLEVSIYPNPTENYFTVQSSVVIYAYDIFDNLGKLVKTANNLNASNFNVEIQSLKSGIHFLILKDVNGVKINQKIVLKGY